MEQDVVPERGRDRVQRRGAVGVPQEQRQGVLEVQLLLAGLAPRELPLRGRRGLPLARRARQPEVDLVAAQDRVHVVGHAVGVQERERDQLGAPHRLLPYPRQPRVFGRATTTHSGLGGVGVVGGVFLPLFFLEPDVSQGLHEETL